ncbi:hypothetical protein CQS04_12330 [Chryseomicrobium excrementi]|uniref:ABC transporter permease n=1 Tax=Chryseomicrobium excrementi TaxID=2041346 RepID=A0A2M9EXS4_9BACL|nr:hypothetical protein [Chryseomicrobium excrementi]PJK16014.1 hypothetical protein CQS04_12330 [Chryseomicrobium excrementi]
MQLFWLEFKKIFSWKLLLLLGVVNFLLFNLLLSFHLEHFPNGRPQTDVFAIEQKLIPLYGAEISEEELQEIKSMYEDRVKIADELVANDPEAEELNLANYEDLVAYNDAQEGLSEYFDQLLYGKGEQILWELQGWEGLIENYEFQADSLAAQVAQNTGAQKEYFQNRIDNEVYSFYSDTVTMNFKDYKTNMAIIIWINVAILLSLVYFRDTRAKLVPLQYSSQHGRNVYRTKWWASLAATTTLVVTLVAVYMALYWTNGTASHLQLPLSSFGWYDHWYDMTFLQYMLLSIGLIVLFAFGVAVLSLSLSTIAPNAVVLIGTQILLFFVMIAGVSTYLIRDMILLWNAPLLTPLATSLFVVVIIVLAWLIWKREIKRDFMN